MVINHNLGAMNALRMSTINTNATSKAMEKLSSGLKINRAGDDAAGLAISEKMRNQIKGLDQASDNGENAISMIQTAEGALNETHSILQRMGQLATQASNSTSKDSDRGQIQKEMDELAKEITRIANDTEFNQQSLLNGGITASGLGASTFQIGANSGQQINLSINAMDSKSLGVSRDTKTVTDQDLTKNIGSSALSTDETDVNKTLADGSYGIEIASVAAGTIQKNAAATITESGAVKVASISNGTVQATAASTITDGGAATGNPSASGSVAVEYKAAQGGNPAAWVVSGAGANDGTKAITSNSPAAAAKIANFQIGATAADTLKFDTTDTNNYTAINGLKIVFDHSASGALSAGYNTASKTITINLSSTQTDNIDSQIQAKINAISTQDNIDFSKIKVTGAGSAASGGVQLSDVPFAGSDIAKSFAGGAAQSSAGVTGGSFTYNGVAYDLSKLSASGSIQSGDKVTFNATAGATGSITADSNVTITYKAAQGSNSAAWVVSGAGSNDGTKTITGNTPAAQASIAAFTLGQNSDTLAFGSSDTNNNTALNDVKIVIDKTGNTAAGSSPTAAYSNTNGVKQITIKLAAGTGDQANNTAAKIQTALRGITNADNIDFSKLTVTGAGAYSSTGVKFSDISFNGADVTKTFSGGSNGSSAGITGGTFTYNGLSFDLSKLTASNTIADGDKITFTVNKDASYSAQLLAADGTTKIGDSVKLISADGGDYTLGDATTGQVKASFDPSKCKVGTTTFTVGTSTAASAVKQTNNTMSKATCDGGLNVSTIPAASAAIKVIQNAVEKVSTERAKLGAYQNRLEHTVANLGTSSENLSSAESRIRDVDMAKEMMEYSKNNVLSQAAQAMIAQAKQQPEQVLTLLR